MRSMFRYGLGLFALVALMTGFSLNNVHAEDAAPTAGKGTVSGTVMQDGKPAANVQVRIVKPLRGGGAAPQAQAGDKKDHARPEAVAKGQTDDKGEFTIADVPEGDYAVIAGSKGLTGRERVTVKAGETAKVSIELKVREPKAK